MSAYDPKRTLKGGGVGTTPWFRRLPPKRIQSGATPVGHSRPLLVMRTFLYAIHPSARALSLASFQARSRNSAWVSGTRLSSFVGKFFARSPGEVAGL